LLLSKRRFSMPVSQLEKDGSYCTLKEAARLKQTTVMALYQYLRNRGIAVVKIGNVILVAPEQIEGYSRTWIKAR
jgi:hypothetical protein